MVGLLGFMAITSIVNLSLFVKYSKNKIFFRLRTVKAFNIINIMVVLGLSGLLIYKNELNYF